MDCGEVAHAGHHDVPRLVLNVTEGLAGHALPVLYALVLEDPENGLLDVNRTGVRKHGDELLREPSVSRGGDPLHHVQDLAVDAIQEGLSGPLDGLGLVIRGKRPGEACKKQHCRKQDGKPGCGLQSFFLLAITSARKGTLNTR